MRSIELCALGEHVVSCHYSIPHSKQGGIRKRSSPTRLLEFEYSTGQFALVCGVGDASVVSTQTGSSYSSSIARDTNGLHTRSFPMQINTKPWRAHPLYPSCCCQLSSAVMHCMANEIKGSINRQSTESVSTIATFCSLMTHATYTCNSSCMYTEPQPLLRKYGDTLHWLTSPAAPYYLGGYAPCPADAGADAAGGRGGAAVLPNCQCKNCC